MNNPAHFYHTWNVFGDNLFASSHEEAERGDFGRVKVCHGPCATGTLERGYSQAQYFT